MTGKKIRARLIGAGKALPQRAVSNVDLAAERGIETSDDWIVERTGIRQRYIAGEGEYTSTLAIAAAQDALRNAGVEASAIDLIIVATTSPDYTFPAVAVQVQAALGLTHGFAFDLQAVCSGFIYALATANSFIQTGQAKRALVIGAETFTRLLDWTDRTTCILFGDGAGAVVVEASDDDTGGIRSTHLHSDGQHRELLYTNGGPSRTGTVGTTVMEGRDVFKHAVQRLAEAVDEALTENNLQPDAIDWLIPHQANRRIIESTAKKLNLPLDRVVLTVAEHGNTSAASIPLALATAVQDGRVKPGDLLLLEAMGGGFTWGSILAKWG